MKEIRSSMEVRHLPRPAVSELGKILQINHTWKDLMALIPEDSPNLNHIPKYSSEDICLISDECSRDGRTGLEVLIEEWGTSGRIRPKVSDLYHLLTKAGLERAALYLENIVLDEIGCKATTREVSSNALEIAERKSVSCMSPPSETSIVAGSEGHIETITIPAGISVPSIPYGDLLEAIRAGHEIGEGAFGSVYKGCLCIEGQEKVVAVKALKECQEETKPLLKKETIFKTELEILSKCHHKNIIKLEGYSCYNQESLGLVYEFMENGSLYDRLACLNSTPALGWKVRLEISEGVAEGIVYLHTNFDPPLVHRDVKSPNILLDSHFVPKLGDFGIVRHGAHGISASTVVKTVPIGTQMYMAPEAFRGDVSVKIDTFSFAIVVLELLTGLPFFDEERENRDLLSYVQEYEDDELMLLDDKAGPWNHTVAKRLFDWTELCTREKKERPNMVQALALMKEIYNEADL